MLSTVLTLVIAAVPTSTAAVVSPPTAPATSPPSVQTAAPATPALLERFNGSLVSFSTSANVQSFAPNLQLTHNPAVLSSVRIAPRFALGRGFALMGRFGFSYEWTNNDFTKTEHEPLLTDTTLTLMYGGLPALPWGTRVTVMANLGLPSSKISQARTMVASPSATVQAAHVFGDVFGGMILVSGSASYEHPFYRFTTPGLADEPQISPQCFAGETGCVSQASGVANAADIVSYSAFVMGSWGIFAPAMALTMSHQFPFGFNDLAGVDRVVDSTTVRVVSSFAAWLDVEITRGATARVGYAMTRNVLDGDGSLGNPLFARYQDGQFFLSARLMPFDLLGPDGSDDGADDPTRRF